MAHVKYCKQKTFYFEVTSVYSMKTNSLKLLKKIATIYQSQKPLEKGISKKRKMFIFKDFGHKLTIYKMQVFSK